jgi:selenide,water dikinase
VLEEARLTSFSHGGGCACKLGSTELAQVLPYVKTSSDPKLLVGLDVPDDAGVFEIAPGLAIVQTVDFFTPIVDDARAWGRIAATNALSDVYAMGGKPITALNLVAWPRDLGFELLGRVLEGANEACEEAGVAVVGGHSVDDPEPKFGLAVTGLVDPEHVVKTRGAVAGDDLVLTKPLGMGLISSGLKAGKTTAATIDRAIEVMSTLNKNACDAMLEVGVDAATDVTGFGLIGHLLEMLGDDLDARLAFGSIPVLEEAFALARDDVLPGGSKRNFEAARSRVEAIDIEQSDAIVLFDAQTSGGLLMAVRPDRTQALLRNLKDRGVADAARVGSVSEGSGRVEVSR